MNTDESNAIRVKDLLFKDTEGQMFMFLKKHDVIRSSKQIAKVREAIINVMALGSGKKTTLPRMPEVIYIVVRDAVFDTIAEVIDGRGRACKASR
jgi:hypothetical protein